MKGSDKGKCRDFIYFPHKRGPQNVELVVVARMAMKTELKRGQRAICPFSGVPKESLKSHIPPVHVKGPKLFHFLQ